MAEIEDLGERIAALEGALAGAQGMAAAFEGELRQMQRSLVLTGREVDTLSRAFGGSLRRAFDGVVFDGVKLSEALRQVARAMVDAVYATALRPVQNALGGAVAQGVQGVMSSLMPFAQGGGFAQGRVMPFARGGVVSGPTVFAMRGGRSGLMGEAGPEAIMPLARGADGRLGVQATGGTSGRPVQVVINVSTPDVEGFRLSQTQIAAQVGRLIARGQRNR
jgi:phage-related minor tail protein